MCIYFLLLGSKVLAQRPTACEFHVHVLNLRSLLQQSDHTQLHGAFSTGPSQTAQVDMHQQWAQSRRLRPKFQLVLRT